MNRITLGNTKCLMKYLLYTFGISWLCWWGEALLLKITSLTFTNIFPMILFTLGGFGPTIAACLCMEGGFSKRSILLLLFCRNRKSCLTW